jgi:D-alanyl-D-alanine carboxypeptidase
MSAKIHSWRRGVFAVVLAVSGCSYTTDDPTPPPSSPSPFAPLEKQVQLFMDEGAGAVVVQIRWPEGEWSKAYGVRDLESRTPAELSDRVGIASVTKTMTAVAVLKLVDDQLIGLDDPVNNVIPGFTNVLKPPGPITVRQLLSHTSGMPEVNEALPRDVDFRPVLPDADDGAGLAVSRDPPVDRFQRRVLQVLEHELPRAWPADPDTAA